MVGYNGMQWVQHTSRFVRTISTFVILHSMYKDRVVIYTRDQIKL